MLGINLYGVLGLQQWAVTAIHQRPQHHDSHLHVVLLLIVIDCKKRRLNLLLGLQGVNLRAPAWAFAPAHGWQLRAGRLGSGRCPSPAAPGRGAITATLSAAPPGPALGGCGRSVAVRSVRGFKHMNGRK